MREMKFRAWSKITKQYFEITHVENGSNTNSKISILEQFTGIYDKNGKEIFEGDLIKIPDDWDTYGMNAGEVYEIFFNAGGFRCKPKINPKARGIWLEDDKEFELIGNIHENPELID